ncbi:MAG TPA: ABC transporter permease [Vicinamibacterales bacterium]|nr:ABC transporter permease [Vicinamibacterales bacterium]
MLNDVRYVVRTLRRAPAFAVSAILALALGIGANTAVFSVVYAVLLKPLPYWQPDRLVRLSEENRETGAAERVVSAGTFVDWRWRARTLESLAVYAPVFGSGETVWNIGDRARIVKTAGVSPALFRVLRVQPVVGRLFRADDEDAPAGALGQFVISYGLWQRAFGGSIDVVGRRVSLEGRLPREIVGVMPPGFDFPDGTEAWTSVPLRAVAAAARRSRSFEAIGRLAPGAAIDDLQRELAGISTQLSAEYPASNAGWTARVEPLSNPKAASSRLPLLVLMIAVAGVLLIGCANVANLLLARATARRAELSVRLALGASPAGIVRLSLIEVGLLCLAGCVAGLAIGGSVARVLVSLAPVDLARPGEVGMNPAVLAFSGAVCVLCITLIGTTSALHLIRDTARRGIRADFRAATMSGAHLRRWVIGGEAAIVMLLLMASLLFLRTFANLRHVDLGFESDHALVVETRWPVGHLLQAAPGTRPWPRVQRETEGLVAAVEGVPGVLAAGIITEIPLTSDPFGGTVWRADAPGAGEGHPPVDPRDRWRADLSVVTPGYFPAMNIRLLRGRNFDGRDRFSDDLLNHSAAPRVGSAIVNNAFAARYFADSDPVGRVIVVDDDREFGALRTIVGVVSDARQRSVAEAARPTVFIPHAQHPDIIRPSLAVRTSLPVAAVAPLIRDRIGAFDPQLVVLGIRPMDAVIAGALSRPRFNLVLMASFAAVALVLAAVGIYGVMAFLVTQRTREIGIRMALGARAADVMRLVLAEGMAPVIAGGAAGLAGSLAATRALQTLLYGVTPLDTPSVAAAPAILVGVALLACVLPARRALRVDPLVALRDE